MERKQITRFVLTALFAALISAGAFIKIPLVPAPVTLQTLFALLAATILPPAMALLSVVSYLLLGVLGLPIFTRWIFNRHDSRSARRFSHNESHGK